MGWFLTQAGELPGSLFPRDAETSPFAGLLIASVGPAMWRVFCGSREAADARSDPLNRWTQRVLGEALTDMIEKRGAKLVDRKSVV